ncbi:MAG: serine O-acetyltransferase [Thiobacillus sp.]
MDAITLYRVANWLYVKKIPFVPSIIQGVIFFLFNTYLPFQARIGKRTRLGHRGIGVVINREAVIGNNVLIRAHVTIGKKQEDGPAPVIEDDVVIGDGAKILGGVRVGRGAQIGANAVVLCDVPEGALAVGVPAVIKAGRYS